MKESSDFSPSKEGAQDIEGEPFNTPPDQDPQDEGRGDVDIRFCRRDYNKERLGWYIYDFANSPYYIFALAFLVPIFLSTNAEWHAYAETLIYPCGKITIAKLGDAPLKCQNVGVDDYDMEYFLGNSCEQDQCKCYIDANQDGEINHAACIPKETGQPDVVPACQFCEPGTQPMGPCIGSDTACQTECITKPAETPFPGACRQCMVGYGTMEFVGSSAVAMEGDTVGGWRNIRDEKTVEFLGFDVSPFGYTSLILSISVIVQVILFISVGPFADYGRSKKPMLIASSSIGSILTACFMFITEPSMYGGAGALVILSNAALGLSMIFYNAYLPKLTDCHPSVRNAKGTSEYDIVRDQVQNHISMTGFLIGYVGGILLTVIEIPFVFLLPYHPVDDEFLAFRVGFLFVALWWGLISIMTYLWLRNDKGKPWPKFGWSTPFLGWIDMGKMLYRCKGYPQTMLFLVSFFFYSDGMTGLAGFGMLYAKNYMCMGPAELYIVLAEVQIMAIAGCWFFKWLAKKIDWNAKKMILLCISVVSFLCFWTFLGFFTHAVGLWNKWEIYVFAFLYGSVTGAWQSYSRVMFSDLTIPGNEAEFFSLFEITDRGSSWLSPLIGGILETTTGDVRYAFIWIACMIGLGALGLFFVDYEKGMRQVGRRYDVIQAARTSMSQKSQKEESETALPTSPLGKSLLARKKSQSGSATPAESKSGDNVELS